MLPRLLVLSLVAAMSGCVRMMDSHQGSDASSAGQDALSREGILLPDLLDPLPEAGFSGWLEGWSYRIKLTVDHTQVAGDLSNFPLLVELDNADLGSKAHSMAEDIRFAAADGVTLLDQEVELFVSPGGHLVAWVRLPSLSSSTDTVLWLYYGNSSTLPTSSTSVWDADYRGVWHLAEAEDETGAAVEFRDSTSFGNSGQGGVGLSGSGDGMPTVCAGIAGNGQHFDGLDDLIDMGTPESLDLTGSALTLSAWISHESGSSAVSYDSYLSKGGYLAGYRMLLRLSDAEIKMQVPTTDDNSSLLYSSGSIPDGSWVQVVGVYDGQEQRLYIDGKLQGTFARTGQLLTTTSPFVIGQGQRSVGSDASYPYKGMVDEVRISTIARSEAWIATTHANISNIENFLSVGEPETVPSL